MKFTTTLRRFTVATSGAVAWCRPVGRRQKTGSFQAQKQVLQGGFYWRTWSMKHVLKKTLAGDSRCIENHINQKTIVFIVFEKLQTGSGFCGNCLCAWSFKAETKELVGQKLIIPPNMTSIEYHPRRIGCESPQEYVSKRILYQTGKPKDIICWNITNYHICHICHLSWQT